MRASATSQETLPFHPNTRTKTPKTLNVCTVIRLRIRRAVQACYPWLEGRPRRAATRRPAGVRVGSTAEQLV